MVDHQRRDVRKGFSTGWQVKMGFPSPPFFVYEITPVSAEHEASEVGGGTDAVRLTIDDTFRTDNRLVDDFRSPYESCAVMEGKQSL